MREIKMLPVSPFQPAAVVSLRTFSPEERARIDHVLVYGDGRMILRFEEPNPETP
jgi:hypothetical protein